MNIYIQKRILCFSGIEERVVLSKISKELHKKINPINIQSFDGVTLIDINKIKQEIDNHLSIVWQIIEKDNCYNYLMRIGALNNIMKLMTISVRNGAFDYNNGNYCAIYKKNIDMFKILLLFNRQIGMGELINACKVGSEEIFDLCTKAHTYNSRELSSVFEYACEGGNIEITQKTFDIVGSNFTGGFNMACRAGKINIVGELSRLFPICMKFGLIDSCYSGNLDLVKMMCKYEKSEDEIKEGIYMACLEGHGNIFDFLFDERKHREIINICLEKANTFYTNEKNRKELIKKLMGLGAIPNVMEYMYCAFKIDNSDELINMLDPKDKCYSDQIYYDACLGRACHWFDIEMVNKSIKYGAKNFNYSLAFLCANHTESCGCTLVHYPYYFGGNIVIKNTKYSKIAKILIELGANNCEACYKNIESHLEF